MLTTYLNDRILKYMIEIMIIELLKEKDFEKRIETRKKNSTRHD